MVNSCFYKSFQIFRNFILQGKKVTMVKFSKYGWNGIVGQWSALVTLTCQMFPVLGCWGGFVRLSWQAGGWLCSSTLIKSPVALLSLAAKRWHSHRRELGWLMGLKESKAKWVLYSTVHWAKVMVRTPTGRVRDSLSEKSYSHRSTGFPERL